MRLMINIDRIGKSHRKLRIRCGWDESSKDDLRLLNLGVEFYNMWKDVLEKIKDENTEIVFEGRRS